MSVSIRRCFMVLALTLSIVTTSYGQLLSSKQKVSTEFLPESAFAMAVVFPKQIAEDPDLDVIPREIITAWGQKELGFDPMLITQATFVLQRMDNLMGPPKYAAILQFEEMQGLAGNMIDQLNEKKVEGKTLFSSRRPDMPSFMIYDEATMFVGDESMFAEMVQAKKNGDLERLVKNRKINGELLAFADIKPIRPILNQLLAQIPAMMPPAVVKLKQVPELLEGVEFGVSAKSLKTQLILHGIDEESTEKAGKIVSRALKFSSDMGVGMMASQMDFDDPVQEAVVEYVQRISEMTQEDMNPVVDATSITMNLSQEASVVPVMVGLLLPAVQQTRAAARRTSSMNNVRQMTLAFHNYTSATGSFPTQANYDKNGKPLLSWRVHILPYIEQNDLYQEFHLDEPWDSPHNRKLIARMPPVYQSPTVAYREGHTVYLGVAGEGHAFTDKKRSFESITDGTSNTILMVEVDDTHAVPWTKPEDWQPSDRNPLEGLGSVNPGGFIVTMMDGSSRFISNGIDPETWKALLTTGGGEVTNNF